MAASLLQPALHLATLKELHLVVAALDTRNTGGPCLCFQLWHGTSGRHNMPGAHHTHAQALAPRTRCSMRRSNRVLSLIICLGRFCAKTSPSATLPNDPGFAAAPPFRNQQRTGLDRSRFRLRIRLRSEVDLFSRAAAAGSKAPNPPCLSFQSFVRRSQFVCGIVHNERATGSVQVCATARGCARLRELSHDAQASSQSNRGSSNI